MGRFPAMSRRQSRNNGAAQPWSRRAFLACCLLGCATAWGLPAAERRASGRDYVRLSSWAAQNGFDLSWTKKDEQLRLSGQSGQIQLRVDSREARFNGVLVWLLFPVARQNGRIYISGLDVETTLRPLMNKARPSGARAVRTVCLDPGHGGRDPGYRVGGRSEKTYTLLLAQELKEQLNRAGYSVILTRTADTYVPLETRPDIARRRRADILVSLHFNSAGAPRSPVRGAEVYCLTPAGAPSTNAAGEGGGGTSDGNRFNEANLQLAYSMQRALVRGLAVEDRGVRRARFAVLREASMPAVLIEAGFMSHSVEGPKIFTPGYRRLMARAIVEGLMAYKGAGRT